MHIRTLVQLHPGILFSNFFLLNPQHRAKWVFLFQVIHAQNKEIYYIPDLEVDGAEEAILRTIKRCGDGRRKCSEQILGSSPLRVGVGDGGRGQEKEAFVQELVRCLHQHLHQKEEEEVDEEEAKLRRRTGRCRRKALGRAPVCLGPRLNATQRAPNQTRQRMR